MCISYCTLLILSINFGLLWAHSSFPFEDANGWLTDLFHGSRAPANQVFYQHCIKIQIDKINFYAFMLTRSPLDNQPVHRAPTAQCSCNEAH